MSGAPSDDNTAANKPLADRLALGEDGAATAALAALTIAFASRAADFWTTSPLGATWGGFEDPEAATAVSGRGNTMATTSANVCECWSVGAFKQEPHVAHISAGKLSAGGYNPVQIDVSSRRICTHRRCPAWGTHEFECCTFSQRGSRAEHHAAVAGLGQTKPHPQRSSVRQQPSPTVSPHHTTT